MRFLIFTNIEQIISLFPIGFYRTGSVCEFRDFIGIHTFTVTYLFFIFVCYAAGSNDLNQYVFRFYTSSSAWDSSRFYTGAIIFAIPEYPRPLDITI